MTYEPDETDEDMVVVGVVGFSQVDFISLGISGETGTHKTKSRNPDIQDFASKVTQRAGTEKGNLGLQMKK